jgi:hypothetical protein
MTALLTTTRTMQALQWLTVAVTMLLFAQWPLRELVGAGAVLANDVAQVLFALYVSVAVAHAGARGAHLAAHPEALARSQWRRIGAALLPLPWCVWLLATGVQPVWRSVIGLERFPETFNAGYFIIKAALLVLALGVAAQSLRDLRSSLRTR